MEVLNLSFISAVSSSGSDEIHISPRNDNTKTLDENNRRFHNAKELKERIAKQSK